MCSRFPIESCAILSCCCCCRPAIAACTLAGPAEQPDRGRRAVIASALSPGLAQSLVTVDPRAAPYYDNAEAVNDRQAAVSAIQLQRLPLERRRRNGPPAHGRSVDLRQLDSRKSTRRWWRDARTACRPGAARYRIEQLWQLAAYVRSMSLPQTLAAQSGDTPLNHRPRCRGKWIRTPAGRRLSRPPTITPAHSPVRSEVMARGSAACGAVSAAVSGARGLR